MEMYISYICIFLSIYFIFPHVGQYSKLVVVRKCILGSKVEGYTINFYFKAKLIEILVLIGFVRVDLIEH